MGVDGRPLAGVSPSDLTRSDFGTQTAFGFEDAGKGDVGWINSSGSSCSTSSTLSRWSVAVLSDFGTQVACGFEGVGTLSEG